MNTAIRVYLICLNLFLAFKSLFRLMHSILNYHFSMYERVRKSNNIFFDKNERYC